MTDAQLAREYTETVLHSKLEASSEGVEKAQERVVGIADANCDVLRHSQRDGYFSTSWTPAQNAPWLKSVQESFGQNTGLTPKQVSRALIISARYKCPDFTSTIEAFTTLYDS
ncbi:hypothetical protein [Nocardia sp. NPDC019302]|uniref:hypothetical protein n=1 Tax=Nocardia sp. NPDC019302 TaxID=3154592 RepID=UPI0033CB3DDB